LRTAIAGRPQQERFPLISVPSSMAATKYRLWTQEDDRRLLELHAAGRSAISMSAALRRSKSAVIGRLCLLKAQAKSSQLRQDAAQNQV